MANYTVGITDKPGIKYPSTPPYDPPEIYPELSGHLPINEIDEENEVFPLIRENFKLLAYDNQNFGSRDWNPLGNIVKPGMTVFIKPNMIAEKHKLNNDWDYVITHGSVIRAVLDYVVLALKGEGHIVIGDGPQSDSKFTEIIKLMGLREIQEHYRKFSKLELEVINLQTEYWISKDGIYTDVVKLSGDPNGNISVDLGANSMFSEYDGKGKKYYGAYYDVDETNSHHKDGRHEYLLARSPVRADVFIGIPKLKTHKKCGVTLNLKGTVGLNANKNWLPHYVFGAPESGGDQFPVMTVKRSLENMLVERIKKKLTKNNSFIAILSRKFKNLGYHIFGNTEVDTIRSGNWHGNDTIWRTCLDLNRILLYYQVKENIWNSNDPKPFLSIVDGIIAMEGNGPVAGDPKHSGIIVIGDNPVSVDIVCAKIMGFDHEKIPLISRALDNHVYQLIHGNVRDISVVSGNTLWNKALAEIIYEDSLKFKPAFGWIGHL